MTIEQLQAFIDSKPDLRSIINEMADYLQANPGGGGGLTIYSGDGTLGSDRTVDLNGKILDFQWTPGQSLFRIDPVGFSSSLRAADGTASSGLSMNGNLASANAGLGSGDGPGLARISLQGNSSDGYNFELSAEDGVNTVTILGDAGTNAITYTADTHTFNGVINLSIHANPSPQDGDVWRVDNTDTGLKIRINGITKTITVS